MRDGFGEGLLKIGQKDQRVVVLSADVVKSTRAHLFAERFPNRFFQVGVAEQNLAGIAAGLALEGFIPYTCTYAAFQPGRNLDQLRVSIAHQKANVKIIGSNSGLLAGYDGASHQMLEDIAIMRSLPNMTVVVPADFNQAKQATIAIAQLDGPTYLRISKTSVNIIPVKAGTQDPTSADTTSDFKIGKAQMLKTGRDVTIIACGIMVSEALSAADKLDSEGISASVVNCHTIKPLDVKSLLTIIEPTSAVVTAEEAQINGGLGSAICEMLSTHSPKPVKMIGVKDKFGFSGDPRKLLELFGLTAESITRQVKEILNK